MLWLRPTTAQVHGCSGERQASIVGRNAYSPIQCCQPRMDWRHRWREGRDTKLLGTSWLPTELRMPCRDGCHHCGRRRGKTIGDHMPPNKMVFGSSKQLTAEVKAQVKAALGVPAKPAARHLKPKVTTKRRHWATQLKRLVGVDQPVGQRYYPQCAKCCQKQAHAVHVDRRTLVLHMAGPKPWFYAGV